MLFQGEAAGGLSRIVVTGMVTCATGLVSSFLIPLLSRRFSADHSTQSASAELDFANKQIAFWKDWLAIAALAATPEQMADDKNVANAALLEIAEEVRAARPLGGSPQTGMLAARAVRPAPRGVRGALLLYAPARPLGWLPRVMFYAYLVLLGILVVNFWLDRALASGLAWTLLTVALAMAVVLRLVAGRME